MNVIDLDDVKLSAGGLKAAPRPSFGVQRFKVPQGAGFKKPQTAPAVAAAPTRSLTQFDLSGSKLGSAAQQMHLIPLPQAPAASPVALAKAPVMTPEKAFMASQPASGAQDTMLRAAARALGTQTPLAFNPQTLIAAAAAAASAASLQNPVAPARAPELVQSLAPVKRGRGRPPKNATALATPAAVFLKKDEHWPFPMGQEASITPSVPAPAPAVVVLANPMLDANGQPVKRGRGRPKKIAAVAPAVTLSAPVVPVQTALEAIASAPVQEMPVTRAPDQGAEAQETPAQSISRAPQRIIPKFVSPLQGLELRAEERQKEEEQARLQPGQPGAQDDSDAASGFLKFAAAALAGEPVSLPARSPAPENKKQSGFSAPSNYPSRGRKAMFKTEADLAFLRQMSAKSTPVTGEPVAPTWTKLEAWDGLNVKRSFDEPVVPDTRVHKVGDKISVSPLMHEEKVNLEMLTTLVPAMESTLKELQEGLQERIAFAQNHEKIVSAERKRGYEQGLQDWKLARQVILEVRRQVARHIANDVRYHVKTSEAANFPFREILQFSYPMISDVAMASADDLMEVRGMDLKKLNAVITYFEMNHLMHLITSAKLKSE